MQPIWIRLERWRIGGRVFHIPKERTYEDPGTAVDISGVIEHANHGRLSEEAGAWLFLLFDRPTFFRWLYASRACGWTWCPLVNLQRVVATFVWRWKDWQHQQAWQQDHPWWHQDA